MQAVQAWLRGAAAAGLPLRLALELNRAQSRNDPGTDYASLLALHRRIAHAHVGFCWDFGHACHNVRQGRLPADPPPAFLEHVIHTHIHDLGANDRTHWPLATPGTVPLERWLGLLAASGYAGILNIELEPARFADTVDVRRAVFASIERLAEWRKRGIP